MSIIALRAWYIQDYEPIAQLEKRPPDLRLSKKSLLKSALRADFLEDIDHVRQSDWFGRYLEGETIEFYIEGSGGYSVANIDLISHEIYFTKQALLSQSEPTIFLSSQVEYPVASDVLREELQASLDSLNLRSRVTLTLLESHRPGDAAIKLTRAMMRKIRRCLLFIADTTPITTSGQQTNKLIPSPPVCVDIGYALHSKRPEQILLAQMQRSDCEGEFPFDLPTPQIITFQDSQELHKILTPALEMQLARFKLFFRD